ncbi:notch-regulated ankyrin repeat-containing protein-like [Stegodyphus dumicola]
MSQTEVQTGASNQEVFLKAVRKGDTTELQKILQRWEGALNVNFYDKEGQTALHQSCMDGNLELVKLLVKFGADVRLANRDGWSALHIAAYGGHQDIALYLIANSRR